jgi:hypothetical protein
MALLDPLGRGLQWIGEKTSVWAPYVLILLGSGFLWQLFSMLQDLYDLLQWHGWDQPIPALFQLLLAIRCSFLLIHLGLLVVIFTAWRMTLPPKR